MPLLIPGMVMMLISYIICKYILFKFIQIHLLHSTSKNVYFWGWVPKGLT
jgi:hypothetical protein